MFSANIESFVGREFAGKLTFDQMMGFELFNDSITMLPSDFLPHDYAQKAIRISPEDDRAESWLYRVESPSHIGDGLFRLWFSLERDKQTDFEFNAACHMQLYRWKATWIELEEGGKEVPYAIAYGRWVMAGDGDNEASRDDFMSIMQDHSDIMQRLSAAVDETLFKKVGLGNVYHIGSGHPDMGILFLEYIEIADAYKDKGLLPDMVVELGIAPVGVPVASSTPSMNNKGVRVSMVDGELCPYIESAGIVVLPVPSFSDHQGKVLDFNVALKQKKLAKMFDGLEDRIIQTVIRFDAES